MREDWGPRLVFKGKNSKEEILWGKHLKCCIGNPHPVGDEPYDALAHKKWNREKLRKVKAGTLVQHLVQSVGGCTYRIHAEFIDSSLEDCRSFEDHTEWIPSACSVFRSSMQMHPQAQYETDKKDAKVGSSR